MSVHRCFANLKKKEEKITFFVLFYFLLSRMDNASRQRFDYATGERETTCLGALLQPCAAHESDADVCVCVFPVETTVDDKPPTASQETEQPSVPVHTGKFCSITLVSCVFFPSFASSTCSWSPALCFLFFP